MNEKKLTKDCTILPVYYLSEKQYKELDIEEWNEYVLFEWDPDFFVTKEWETIYFFIRSDKNIIVTSQEFEYENELKEFCLWQNTKVSIWGYNTRSETKNWNYLEKNNWNGWNECKNMKIAYRWGCGYCYSLFEYVK